MSIESSFKRIANWLSENAPELCKIVGSPATSNSIKALRNSYADAGRTFPESLCEYLSVFNGQKDDMEDEGKGLVPAGNDPFKLHSVRMFENDIGLPSDFSAGKFECSQEIQPVVFDTGWFAFATDWSRLLAVDTNPTEFGVSGQVIAVDYESPLRVVISDSLASFFDSLATNFEKGYYKWNGELLRATSNECFPNLNSLSSLLVEPSGSPSTPSHPDGKYLVTVRSAVDVRSTSGRKIRSAKRLANLDGQFTQDSVLNYMDAENRELLNDNGGHICIQYDNDAESVFVCSQFGCQRKLTKKQLDEILDDTVGQWSDGLGSGFTDHIENECQLNVELCPYESVPVITQTINMNAT